MLLSFPFALARYEMIIANSMLRASSSSLRVGSNGFTYDDLKAITLAKRREKKKKKKNLLSYHWSVNHLIFILGIGQTSNFS